MKVIKLKNTFKVESSTKGRFYSVDLSKPSCDCPHFRFGLRGCGECKHILAAKDKYPIKKSNNILDFVRKKGEVNSIELIKKFGDKTIDDLIRSGDLIEQYGKIKVLE